VSALSEGEYKEVVERLRAVNEVIKDLEPAVQEAAVAILRPYLVGDGAPTPAARTDAGNQTPPAVTPTGSGIDIEALLDEHAGDSATENGFLVAAIFYAQYGKGPYEVKELKRFADEHALLFPEQFHKSVGKVKRDGANVFRKVTGGWQITTHGEKWMRKTFHVSRGTQPRPNA